MATLENLRQYLWKESKTSPVLPPLTPEAETSPFFLKEKCVESF